MTNGTYSKLPKPFSTVTLLLLATMMAGCFGEDQVWNGKDISGLMPGLQYELTNTEGKTVTESDSAERVRLMFFGFTSCPDVCPTTLQKLSKAVNDLPAGIKKRTQILFVSVDPNRDTPERIASYVNFYSDRITGLTGNEPALRELSKRYRTTFGYDEPDADGNYAVSHSSAVYVFDREGDARLLFRPDLSVEQIRNDLVALSEEG